MDTQRKSFVPVECEPNSHSSIHSLSPIRSKAKAASTSTQTPEKTATAQIRRRNYQHLKTSVNIRLTIPTFESDHLK